MSNKVEETLKKNRTVLRTKITKFCNKNESLNITDFDEIEMLVEDLTKLRTEIQSLNSKLHEIDGLEGSDLEFELEEDETYDRRSGLLIKKLEKLLKSSSTNSMSQFPTKPAQPNS